MVKLQHTDIVFKLIDTLTGNRMEDAVIDSTGGIYLDSLDLQHEESLQTRELLATAENPSGRYQLSISVATLDSANSERQEIQ